MIGSNADRITYRKIDVKIEAARGWPIVIGDGVLSKLSELFDFEPYSAVVLIADVMVNRLYGRQVIETLAGSGKRVLVLIVPRGENSKCLEEAERGYKFLLNSKIDRRALLCVLGGGVVGDLGGYIAATYLRGIDYIQLPTTLLAQVDSSIGGKVGVNFAGKKNMIGCFYQPKAVISDVSLLKSLPIGEMRNGIAEVIKYGLAMDENLFHRINNGKEKALAGSELVDIIERCSLLKVNVVEKDETERSGERAILNFGHTVGHALEAATGLVGRHGEAIAVGMTAAARISERTGMLGRDNSAQISEVLTSFGLPTRCPGVNPAKMLQAIQYDKKAARGQVKWVLLDRIGHGVIDCAVDETIVREVLEELCR